MRNSKSVLVVGATVLALAGATSIAIASHGKPGLWSVNMSIAGQNTSQMSPEALAQMKAAGMIPNASGGFTVQHCMTAAEVADDSRIVSAGMSGCSLANKKIAAHAMSADIVCKAPTNGSGHVSVNYDSTTHYTGHLTMTGKAANGTTITQNQDFDGHWIANSCGAVNH